MSTLNARANIRIEILNDISNDDVQDPSEEEGELHDDEDDSVPDESENTKQPMKQNLRITAVNAVPALVTETDAVKYMNMVDNVYHSLGLVADEVNEAVRFEAVHVLGTTEMTTLDILKYFLDHSPTAIELVDDNSCNVLWKDPSNALRALHSLSKTVEGMPVLENDEGQTDTVLRNLNREVEIADEPMDVDALDELAKKSNHVTLRDISIKVPLGYWRLGKPSDKSKCILLRYALNTDPMPKRAEHFTEYYRQCGINPIAASGLVGLVSESRKRKFQDTTKRGSWTSLAKDWYQDHLQGELYPTVPRTTISTATFRKPSEEFNHRLGFRRAFMSQDLPAEDDENSVVVVDKEEEIMDPPVKVRKSKVKMPRMRMYADDEEEKQKRKKMLRALKKKAATEIPFEEVDEDKSDLRHMLGKKRSTKVEQKVIQLLESDAGQIVNDVSSKIKSRNKLIQEKLPIKTGLHADEIVAKTNNTERKRSELRFKHSVSQRASHNFRSHINEISRPKRVESHRPSRPRVSQGMRSDHYENDLSSQNKTKSKVMVVVRKPPRPTVASTVCMSRTMKADRVATTPSVRPQQRLKMRVVEQPRDTSGRRRPSAVHGRRHDRRSTSSTDESSSSSESSDSSSSSSENSDDDSSSSDSSSASSESGSSSGSGPGRQQPDVKRLMLAKRIREATVAVKSDALRRGKSTISEALRMRIGSGSGGARRK